MPEGFSRGDWTMKTFTVMVMKMYGQMLKTGLIINVNFRSTFKGYCFFSFFTCNHGIVEILSFENVHLTYENSTKPIKKICKTGFLVQSPIWTYL